jgi:tRNA-modifying protein YgfZ
MSEGYEALRRGAVRLDLTGRGRLRVTGRDRARLLHNVTSNEVKKLTPGSGCYAFLLTPQGRIQADLTLFCFADHFLIDTEPELRERVPQLILKYKVADQVEVEDISDRTWAIGVEGPEASAVLTAEGAPVPSTAYAHSAWGEFTVANVSVTGQPGFRVFGPAERQPPKLSGVVALASDDDIRQVRIENGRPRFGEDIRETTLPQEAQQMHAVSFLKGCYIGQEIVERIRAQGHVNKKLVRLAIEAEAPPAPGTKLMLEGKEAGEITSAVESPSVGGIAALGYVRVPSAEPGTVLDAGGLAARVV